MLPHLVQHGQKMALFICPRCVFAAFILDEPKCSQDEIAKEKSFVKVLFTMSRLAQW